MLNENDFKKIVVENLIYYRKLNKLTQLQLAEKLNYSDKAISKWERCECYPDIIFLPGLARLLECTTDDFFEEPCIENQQTGEYNSTNGIVKSC